MIGKKFTGLMTLLSHPEMTDKQFLIAIGKNITAIRKEKKIMQADLAYQCDMEIPNLIRLEKGRTNPTSLTLRKLSKVLKVSVKRFYDGTD